MSDPVSKLGLNCPAGGDFYICQGNSTQFLGCCTSDPCSDGKGECPQDDLRYSSFNESTYADIQPQECANSTAGSWYTCSETDSPFLGCCSTNACDDGCPTEDLLAAKLSDNEKSAAIFETTAKKTATTATTATMTTMAAASSTRTTSNATATCTAGASQSTGSSGLSTGAKVGIGVGCAVAIAALLAALIFFGRRYLRSRRGVVVTGSPPSAFMSNPTSSYFYGKIHLFPTGKFPPPPPPPAEKKKSKKKKTLCSLKVLTDPNQILHTPPPLASPSLEPLAPGLALRSPTGSNERPYSPEYQPSMTGSASPPSMPAQLKSHPSSMYQPYRPSVQEFRDPNSGLYP